MIKHEVVLALLCLLCANHTAAFYASPATPLRSTAVRRGGVTQSTNRLERSASYSDGDSGDATAPTAFGSTKTTEGRPAAVGWTKRAGSRRQRGAQQPRQDWSKLFATPEPEPVQGRPLSGLSRSFGAAATRNMGSSPLFLGMVLLTTTFSPLLAARPLAAWGIGRLTYWLSLRDEDVSIRLSAGFVGYASLFLMVGGQLTVNGLKCIACLH